MWVLVVGKESSLGRPEGAVLTLEQLGCHVHGADLWDPLEDPHWRKDPPAVVVIEALDEVEAGRAALARIQTVPALAEVPTLLAVGVPGVNRLREEDGFDDFVLAPYVPAELYSRIRRLQWEKSEFQNQERIKFGSVCIDLAAHEVDNDGRPVVLTHQEFALLAFLAQHRGRVFTREQLLGRVWGVEHYGPSRTVDIHIQRLRTKLGRGAEPIETVRGVGYKMRAPL